MERPLDPSQPPQSLPDCPLALDAALARTELAGVELKVTLSRALHPDNDPAAIREAVVGFLPRAQERGVLCVRCA